MIYEPKKWGKDIIGREIMIGPLVDNIIIWKKEDDQIAKGLIMRANQIHADRSLIWIRTKKDEITNEGKLKDVKQIVFQDPPNTIFEELIRSGVEFSQREYNKNSISQLMKSKMKAEEWKRKKAREKEEYRAKLLGARSSAERIPPARFEAPRAPHIRYEDGKRTFYRSNIFDRMTIHEQYNYIFGIIIWLRDYIFNDTLSPAEMKKMADQDMHKYSAS